MLAGRSHYHLAEGLRALWEQFSHPWDWTEAARFDVTKEPGDLERQCDHSAFLQDLQVLEASFGPPALAACLLTPPPGHLQPTSDDCFSMEKACLYAASRHLLSPIISSFLFPFHCAF